MTVDPYAANPFAEQARTADPERFAAISKLTPAPQMFAGGTADLPAFTASGADPRLLLKLPYGVRHHAASIASLAELHDFFESHSSNPNARVEHDGLHAAEARAQHWLQTDTRAQEEIDAEYAAFFPKDTSAEDVAARRARAEAEYQEGSKRWAAARGGFSYNPHPAARS